MLQSLATAARQDKLRREKGVRSVGDAQYDLQTNYVITSTFTITSLIFSLLYALTTPTLSLSYLLGGACGFAYIVSLSKFVNTIGASAIDELGELNPQAVSDAGGGAARFAYLGVLFVLIKIGGGGFDGSGIFTLIPAIAGFFTYQISTVLEGQRKLA